MNLRTAVSVRNPNVLGLLVLMSVLPLLFAAGCSEQDVAFAPENAPNSSFQDFRTMSNPDTTTTSQVVGAAGGTVTAGPAKVIIPPQALLENVTITVTGIDDTTVSCELLPHGQTFLLPVVLVMDRNDPEHDTIEWLDEATSVWVDLDGRVNSSQITVSLEHFSLYQTAMAFN